MNYLFSMLLTTPTDKWFKSLDSLTSHFYWNNKNARRKKKLRQTRSTKFPYFIIFFSKSVTIQSQMDSTTQTQQLMDRSRKFPMQKYLNLRSNFPTRFNWKNSTSSVISTALSAWWKANRLILNYVVRPIKVVTVLNSKYNVSFCGWNINH